MEERTILWSIIGILFLALSFFVFRAGATGNTITSLSNEDRIDTSSWTENEIMNYEMHGTIPSRINGRVAASSYNGMVGGC